MSLKTTCRIDISGHAIPIPYAALENFTKCQDFSELYTPCTMNDAHLLILMDKPFWKNIKVLGLSCLCVDGEMKERQKDGMSCNRFTDHVLVEFLDHVIDSGPQHEISIFLPLYLIALKTGKRFETIQWLSVSMNITKREKDCFWYKERIKLLVTSNRLATFF